MRAPLNPVYFAQKNTHAANFTMLYEELLYCILFRAIPTCEWQLSHSRLCIRPCGKSCDSEVGPRDRHDSPYTHLMPLSQPDPIPLIRQPPVTHPVVGNVWDFRMPCHPPGRQLDSPHDAAGGSTHRHMIRSGKVPNDAVRISNAHVTDEWEEPCQQGNGCPHDAERIAD